MGLALVCALQGCGRDPAPAPAGRLIRQSGQCFPQSVTRALDLLLVIDNSPSMAGESARLGAQLDALVQALASIRFGFPDAHIGVISTDVGTGSSAVAGCTETGDAGRLLRQPRSDCQPPDGAYLDITNWDAVLRGNVPDADASGEIEVSDIQAALRCVGLLGAGGCGYEQPLEAALRALTCTETECPNSGFLRPEAVLVVVFITDEDDCSASSDVVFDPDLPTEGGCRCFDLGVTCTASGCEPNEESTVVHPVQRYYDFLSRLKPAGRVIVGAVTGPFAPGAIVDTTTDAQGNCVLVPSCTRDTEAGFPAVRIADLVRRFAEYGVMLSDDDGAGICGDDYSPVLARLGGYHGGHAAGCISEPLVRADGAIVEEPADAICVVTEVNDDGRRDLQRCVFMGAAPLACPYDESPGAVVEAPCWYLCDEGPAELGGCEYRWMMRTCREPTCAPYVAARPYTDDCINCLTCDPLAPGCE